MQSKPRSSPKLLAIDDSALIHRLLRARLRSERIEIHTAQSGKEGLRLAASIMPEVILLDMDLPDGSGYSVLRRLKSDPALHDIPVIFLSRSGETADKVRGLEMGAIDFITKPFEMAELTARVRSAVQIRQLINMLAQRARIDALTGLWNRAYFDERLSQEFSEAQRHHEGLALVFCDIDHFKALNDRYGHPFGDHVLREFAGLLRGGRTGDICCRYGGEEFVMIIPRAVAEEAAKIAERIREAVSNVTWEGHPRLTVTASFGVSDLARLENATPQDLVASADAALYAAKEDGRDQVYIAELPDQSLRMSA